MTREYWRICSTHLCLCLNMCSLFPKKSHDANRSPFFLVSLRSICTEKNRYRYEAFPECTFAFRFEKIEKNKKNEDILRDDNNVDGVIGARARCIVDSGRWRFVLFFLKFLVFRHDFFTLEAEEECTTKLRGMYYKTKRTYVHPT